MIVNNYSQYCSIVKTGVGPTKIILGGEVDASKPHDAKKKRIHSSNFESYHT